MVAVLFAGGRRCGFSELAQRMQELTVSNAGGCGWCSGSADAESRLESFPATWFGERYNDEMPGDEAYYSL